MLAMATCVLAYSGCASGSQGGGDVAEPGDVFAADLPPGVLQGSVPASSNPNLLTGDQLRETNVGNVYDALRRLRPQWLRTRGASSIVSPEATEPVVYVSGIRRGEPRTLQNVNVDQVRSVQFIDARDATTRFGTGHGGGVIMVDVDRN
jgi:hypothetical protein